MRITIFLAVLIVILSSCNRANQRSVNSIEPAIDFKIEPVGLENVRLLDGPFKDAMDQDIRWLLALEPDRLLHRYLLYAGLEPKGENYGGWESRGISGHSLGHYLSAISLAFAATGDLEFKDRANYIVAELERCQETFNNGYVGAIPGQDSVWLQIAGGDIRSQGFDLNGLWVPWYTQHKVLAGLLDVYRFTESEDALKVAIKFSDWMDDTLKGLSDEQFQDMLACEYGGMNDVLAQLYEITGEAKYLNLANRFYHQSVMDPLASQKDELAGQHANTQVPKIVGAAKIYELTGSVKDSTVAAFFLRKVLKDHSYANGGNSEHEHFGPAGQLGGRLSESSSETCNTYNMIKLAQHVNKWEFDQTWGDYIEKALFNHILASQNPQDGMVCYFVPLQAGGRKTYSDAFDSFWCCVGSGWENHAKYGSYIYYTTVEGALVVDQYISSELSTNNYQLRLDTSFPKQSEIKITIEELKGDNQSVYLRLPSWCDSYNVLINDKQINAKVEKGYIKVEEVIEGDVITLSLNMKLHEEKLIGDDNKVAMFYGPVMLAGVIPEKTDDFDYPVFLVKGKKYDDWVKWNSKRSTANTVGVGYPEDILLKPFYEIVNEKYLVYLNTYDEKGWSTHKEKNEKERLERYELEVRTLDLLRIGEMQPERDHELEGENTISGDAFNRKWRHAIDGWFSFKMKIDPNVINELMVTYWGGDTGNREFQILVNNQLVADQILDRNHPDEFYDEVYELPNQLTKGKKEVKITFKSLPGKTAGGVYGCRTATKQ
ncbi:MAG: glycoside hydrolase family 127 protein [Reichenbachiella sp.]